MLDSTGQVSNRTQTSICGCVALVVEDEFPDLTGKLSTLPLALAATSRLTLAGCRRSVDASDGNAPADFIMKVVQQRSRRA